MARRRILVDGAARGDGEGADARSAAASAAPSLDAEALPVQGGQPQATPRRRGRPRKTGGAVASGKVIGDVPGKAPGARARSAPPCLPVTPDPAVLAGPDPLAATGWPDQVAELAARKHLEVLATVEALRAQGRTIYPARGDVFRALRATPWDAVRVVILGQDPYHGPGQAHGLAFSVADGVPPPRSLRNIFKEVAADCGAGSGQPGLGDQTGKSGPSSYPSWHPAGSAPAGAPLLTPFGNVPPESAAPSGNLSRWAAQGVLLLNTVLTVEDGQPNSHAGLGWEDVTRGIVAALGARSQPCAFLLWGRPAHGFAALVTHPAHLVLTAAHPSPLSASRGFFGCAHFSRVNAWLAAQGEAPIHW
ncbi:uracil-DNA glycosylase [Nitratidesulfovibrio liaohensis]|uniref:Uracil-DNA glycosylase n=1 Tax=Nitratidesulfovibrio liaohensis TaxID=2604158 RepID=A0ABY9R627_9BACT|nr:uracil-DNA glycosylase [Nitratidesulfovibrio liaohensis]WMW67193.1 uracil-DNA glycosylase [Nitratidesulfovibrio liaohensis]